MSRISFNHIGSSENNNFGKKGKKVARQSTKKAARRKEQNAARHKQNTVHECSQSHFSHDLMLLVSDYLSPAEMVTAAQISRLWRCSIYNSARWRLMQETAKSLSPEDIYFYREDEMKARIDAERARIDAAQARTDARSDKKKDAGLATATCIASAVIVGGIYTGKKKEEQYLQKMCSPYAHLGIDISHYNHSTLEHSLSHHIVNAEPLCRLIAGEYNMTTGRPMVAHLQNSKILAGIKAIDGPEVVIPGIIGPFPKYDLHYHANITAGVMLATFVLCLGAAVALNYMARPRHNIEMPLGRQDQVSDIKNDGIVLPQESVEISSLKIPRMVLRPGLVLSRLQQLKSLETDIDRAFEKENLGVIRKLGPAFKAAEQLGLSTMHARLYCRAVTTQNPRLFTELRKQNANFTPELMTHFMHDVFKFRFSELADSRVGESNLVPKKWRVKNIVGQAIRQTPAVEFVKSRLLFNERLLTAFLNAAGDDVKRFITASIPETGHTALHLAAYWGNVDITKILLAHGADWDVKDNTGLMPNQLAPFDESLKALRRQT